MLWLLLSCADRPSDDPVADWAAATGEDFADCGSMALGVCGDEAISAAQQAVVDCLMQAQASCSPAQAAFSRPTLEGDLIYTHWFVVPEDEACWIAKLSDTREDAFGVPGVWVQRCDEVEALERCPWLENGDCAGAERLD